MPPAISREGTAWAAWHHVSPDAVKVCVGHESRMARFSYRGQPSNQASGHTEPGRRLRHACSHRRTATGLWSSSFAGREPAAHTQCSTAKASNAQSRYAGCRVAVGPSTLPEVHGTRCWEQHRQEQRSSTLAMKVSAARTNKHRKRRWRSASQQVTSSVASFTDEQRDESGSRTVEVKHRKRMSSSTSGRSGNFCTPRIRRE